MKEYKFLCFKKTSLHEKYRFYITIEANSLKEAREILYKIL